MNRPDDRFLRSRDVLGKVARDTSGRRVGRVVDLVVAPDAKGRLRVRQALVTDGPWGRLLGYEMDQQRGPWVLRALARRLMHRHIREIPWADVRLEE